MIHSMLDFFSTRDTNWACSELGALTQCLKDSDVAERKRNRPGDSVADEGESLSKKAKAVHED
jgi:hypothetical protein